MKIVYTKANPNKIADQHRKSINNLTGDCKNPRSGFYSSIMPGTKPTNIKTIELIRTHCQFIVFFYWFNYPEVNVFYLTTVESYASCNSYELVSGNYQL